MKAQVDNANSHLELRIATLGSILLDALARAPALPPMTEPVFLFSESSPSRQKFLPAFPRLRQRAISSQRWQKIELDAGVEYAQAVEHYEARKREAELRHDVEQHKFLEQVEQFRKCSQGPVVEHFSRVLLRTGYAENAVQHIHVSCDPGPRQLIVELDLASVSDVIPNPAAYKFVRSGREIQTVERKGAEKDALYQNVIAQICLRVLHEVVTTNYYGALLEVVVNGRVRGTDSETGRAIFPCIVTVWTTRQDFDDLRLDRVDPIDCLRGLGARVSEDLVGLRPVRPLAEFNPADTRFAEERQGLNLLELSPNEFESLVTDLFSAMGLEAKQTQASGDGGVDCVAFDHTPVTGGKIVIQAKRYKNIVGASVVRELYGTLMHEGASKGILVTTSYYGRSAYEFVEEKPLELVNGRDLLDLLKDYCGIDARIVPID